MASARYHQPEARSGFKRSKGKRTLPACLDDGVAPFNRIGLLRDGRGVSQRGQTADTLTAIPTIHTAGRLDKHSNAGPESEMARKHFTRKGQKVIDH